MNSESGIYKITIKKPPESPGKPKSSWPKLRRYVFSERRCIKMILFATVFFTAVTLITGQTLISCPDGSPDCTTEAPEEI